MMTRADIYAAIDSERDTQNTKWPRDVQANPNRAQYRFYAPHIVVLEEKLLRLRKIWYESDRELLRAEFVKIAALAVRALEEVE
jgi:hypothetical protein